MVARIRHFDLVAEIAIYIIHENLRAWNFFIMLSKYPYLSGISEKKLPENYYETQNYYLVGKRGNTNNFVKLS